jgi:hypothetical protein
MWRRPQQHFAEYWRKNDEISCKEIRQTKTEFEKENLDYICSRSVASPSRSLRLFSVECQAVQSTFTTLLDGSLHLPDCLARQTYCTCLQEFVLRFVLKKRGYSSMCNRFGENPRVLHVVLYAT